MADLSTRLLEAIAEAERKINAWEHWQVEDSFYHCCAALRTRDDAGDLPYGECDCGLSERQAEALGFCRAHREIVELAMVCRADYSLAAEKKATSVAVWPAEIREMEDRSLAALTRLQTLELVMSSIARAYGIEEGDSGPS